MGCEDLLTFLLTVYKSATYFYSYYVVIFGSWSRSSSRPDNSSLATRLGLTLYGVGLGLEILVFFIIIVIRGIVGQLDIICHCLGVVDVVAERLNR